MNKKWLKKLAEIIETRHGKEMRNRLFGDIDSVGDCHTSISAWFDSFTSGMDELNDKDFLSEMMTEHCPCGGNPKEDGAIIKKLYDKSKTLDEFVKLFNEWQNSLWGGQEDVTELRGNVLYMTKRPMDDSYYGKCGRGCHCELAKHTDKYISDIFCYCCTVGHTGKPFKAAFGENIKLEFIDSLIIGGKGCTMAIHLPEKNIAAIKRYEVNEDWAHTGMVEAGDFIFTSYCCGNHGQSIEAQINGAFNHLTTRLETLGLTLESVVKFDAMFKNIWDIPVMEKVLKERFAGKYPARKSIQTEFADDRLLFQLDAVAYKNKH